MRPAVDRWVDRFARFVVSGWPLFDTRLSGDAVSHGDAMASAGEPVSASTRT